MTWSIFPTAAFPCKDWPTVTSLGPRLAGDDASVPRFIQPTRNPRRSYGDVFIPALPTFQLAFRGVVVDLRECRADRKCSLLCETVGRTYRGRVSPAAKNHRYVKQFVAFQVEGTTPSIVSGRIGSSTFILSGSHWPISFTVSLKRYPKSLLFTNAQRPATFHLRQEACLTYQSHATVSRVRHLLLVA